MKRIYCVFLKVGIMLSFLIAITAAAATTPAKNSGKSQRHQCMRRCSSAYNTLVSQYNNTSSLSTLTAAGKELVACEQSC
jgi:hypothetical protein